MQTLRRCLASAATFVVASCSSNTAGGPGVDVADSLPESFATRSSAYGTIFDPCGTYSVEDLGILGVTPDLKKAGDVVPGMSTHGCQWSTIRRAVQQVVVRSSSLDAYRNGRDTVAWRPDVSVGSRRIGVFIVESLGDCSTYVQSQQAGVITRLRADGDPDECPEVIEFTKRILHKIPE